MKRAKLEKLLDSAGDLPTLPAVAQNVLEAINNEKTNAQLLSGVIEVDPVIAARVVQLANSSYYRMPGTDEVADIHRAIVVLGFINIRNIVVATCMRSMYSPEFKAHHFTASDLWEHSVMAAVISRAIAEKVVPDQADEAFMAGMIHDIGMIVEWNLFPKLFPQVLNRYQGTGLDFRKAEHDTLGFDHCDAGVIVLRKWQIPKAIRDVAAQHHEIKARKEKNILPKIVHVAEKICCARGDGFFDFIKDDKDIQETLEELNLNQQSYEEIMTRLDEELEKARDLLAL